MPNIHIDEIGSAKLDRINAVLKGVGNGSGAFQAIGAAMNRAAQSGKTQAARYASETYNISQGSFRSRCRISFKMSGGGGGVASIEVLFAGAVIPLIEFHGTSGGPQGGVHVSPKRGGGSLRTAFINAVYGTHGVWERVGRKRFPVEQMYGPSTGHMMQDEGVSDKLVNHMMEVFDSRIEHEISRILGLL